MIIPYIIPIAAFGLYCNKIVYSWIVKNNSCSSSNIIDETVVASVQVIQNSNSNSKFPTFGLFFSVKMAQIVLFLFCWNQLSLILFICFATASLIADLVVVKVLLCH